MPEEKREELEVRPEEVPEWMKDGLELKYIFKAISEFISDVSGHLKKLIDTILEPISGDKLGGEIGAFYRNLRESGVPEELASEMTRRYFESRIAILEAFKSLPSLFQQFQGAAKKGPIPPEAREELREKIKKAIEEAVGEGKPEEPSEEN